MERKIVRLDIDRDFKSFEELSSLAFGENINLDREMHQWLFDNNPYNRAGNMMFLLKEGDKVIGCDGLIPNELYVNGKTVLTAHSIKSMTHPDYQRQGIFRQMTENSVERGRQDGVDVIIGLANAASYPAYQKFGWATLFEKEAYVKPIKIKKLLQRKLRFSPLAALGNSVFTSWNKFKLGRKKDKDITFEQLDIVPPEVQAVWDRFKSKFEVLLVRDYKYLDYRYNQRPDSDYVTLLMRHHNELVGFAILHDSKTKRSVFTAAVELFTDPTNDRYITALLTAIASYCYENDLDYVVISTGHFGRFESVMQQNGFRLTPKPPSNNMMIARVLSDKLTLAEIDGGHKWHITQGDGDTELDI